MKIRNIAKIVCLMLALTATQASRADDPSAEPKAVPKTRPEMKAALEGLKQRTPRLPLPPPTADEIAAANGRPVVGNGRARQLYLPKEWFAADFKADPTMTVDKTMKVQVFWIVSRANNCQYCLGHQELKLKKAGQTEDQIAALDSDWTSYAPEVQVALDFGRKVTLNPHLIDTADIDSLKKHYKNDEVIDIVFTSSFFNNVNRWTDSLGIPQDNKFGGESAELNTPTSENFQTKSTIVGAIELPKRPQPVSFAEAISEIEKAKGRKPRVEIPDRTSVAEKIGIPSGEKLPLWIVAIGNYPEMAKMLADAQRAIDTTGELDAKLKAKIAWTTARNNHSYGAAGVAHARLATLGIKDKQIEAMESGKGSESEGEKAALEFVKKLTVSPQLMTDADIAGLRKHFSDKSVAQIVYVACNANMIDRIYESLQLPVD